VYAGLDGIFVVLSPICRPCKFLITRRITGTYGTGISITGISVTGISITGISITGISVTGISVTGLA